MTLTRQIAHKLPVNAIAIANIFHQPTATRHDCRGMVNRVVRRVDDTIVPAPNGLQCVRLVDATMPDAVPFLYMKDNSVYPIPVTIDEYYGTAYAEA